ncbi:MAG TPA: ABC transporter ATP-binding protein [Candidatus Krumholzibacterium sp.]|nr:ABC transporter ATP-binding protein [Candidatus Krumholzibacterium sp.]
MNVLEFRDIHRAYKYGHDILSGVSFSLRMGEVVGLLGRNGAGKTTLIRIAMGMIEPQKGEVRLFGMDPFKDPVKIKRKVGYVSEDQILPDYLRVEDVIDLHRSLYPDWDLVYEAQLVDRFSIDPRARIRSLSKGQARQVALLCAVSHRPQLLLLDEPAGGLDPAARREFLETSIQMLNETGTTILFSSHYMSDVERLAERVVMIHDGGIFIDDPLDDLREAYSLAAFPLGNGVDTTSLSALPDCVAVRQRRDSIHAVFRLSADQTDARILELTGSDRIRSRSIPLEEMFIELVGGQS